MIAIVICCCLFLIIKNNLFAQTEIVYTPDDPIKEYSGITRWKDHIILIPQKPTDKKLYALSANDVEHALQDKMSATKNRKNEAVQRYAIQVLRKSYRVPTSLKL